MVGIYTHRTGSICPPRGVYIFISQVKVGGTWAGQNRASVESNYSKKKGKLYTSAFRSAFSPKHWWKGAFWRNWRLKAVFYVLYLVGDLAVTSRRLEELKDMVRLTSVLLWLITAPEWIFFLGIWLWLNQIPPIFRLSQDICITPLEFTGDPISTAPLFYSELNFQKRKTLIKQLIISVLFESR